MMKSKCYCGKMIESKHSEKEKLHFLWCPDCKIGGKAATVESAIKIFKSEVEKRAAQNAPATTAPDTIPAPSNPYFLTVPKTRADLVNEIKANALSLSEMAPRFVDKTATMRMINKNLEYLLSVDLKNVWSTEEGVASIWDAYRGALEIAATLPEMGCIVPYNKTAEFIPDIAAFEFALTQGKTAPFSQIMITAIYENDLYEITSRDGSFHFEIKKVGFPRGEIIGVVVQAVDASTGQIIGEAYDVQRLMEKAERHSVSYRYYLQDMAALKKAQAEGKDFIEKKPGWKMYERDIINPYVGPDRPEMLRKLAGKSFFGKFMKTRNARAIGEEWGEDDKPRDYEGAAEKALDRSMSQFDHLDGATVTDGEIVGEAVVAASDGAEKIAGLFGGEKI
jgi:hypothetical protein